MITFWAFDLEWSSDPDCTVNAVESNTSTTIIPAGAAAVIVIILLIVLSQDWMMGELILALITILQ